MVVSDNATSTESWRKAFRVLLVLDDGAVVDTEELTLAPTCSAMVAVRIPERSRGKRPRAIIVDGPDHVLALTRLRSGR